MARGDGFYERRYREFPVVASQVPRQRTLMLGMITGDKQVELLDDKLDRDGGTRPFHGHPFDPIARSKVYFSASPIASGPVTVAVAISGY